MHESALILTLTGSLVTAAALGYVTQRLGLSPIVGYLLAGVIVGPYTPGFVADRPIANELAEIGVILLMFGVGLHFHFKDLLAVKKIAVAGALCQSTVSTLLGLFAGHRFGWSWSASVVFGLALSVASTVMLTRVLVDNHHLQTPAGRIAIGWLVVEDIFTVIVLVLLPPIFGDGSAQPASVMQAAALTVLKLLMLAAFAFVAGGRIIPRVLSAVASTRSRELFTSTVLVVALGLAVGSALAFGVSMALGAFLAGMIVGQSEFSFRAASDALPMRDAFSVLFFVSVGMLLDPAALMNSPGLLAATLAIVLIAKPAAAFAIVFMLGYGSRVGFAVAIALAQIGEFSMILAALGSRLGIFPAAATNLIVAASIVSLILNPLLYRSTPRLEAALQRCRRIWRWLNAEASVSPDIKDNPPAAPAPRAVIVGYGPVGRTVCRLLGEGGIEPVVIDTNLESTRLVRNAGHRSIYGDATHPDVLEAAGIRDASALVLSRPEKEQAVEIIRLARKMNPGVQVLSGSYYLSEAAVLHEAGADRVFSGEGEVALAMTEYILDLLGATPEEIDRERSRARKDIFPAGAQNLPPIR